MPLKEVGSEKKVYYQNVPAQTCGLSLLPAQACDMSSSNVFSSFCISLGQFVSTLLSRGCRGQSLLQELSHAFFYIVREGEESYPPEARVGVVQPACVSKTAGARAPGVWVGVEIGAFWFRFLFDLLFLVHLVDFMQDMQATSLVGKKRT